MMIRHGRLFYPRSNKKVNQKVSLACLFLDFHNTLCQFSGFSDLLEISFCNFVKVINKYIVDEKESFRSQSCRQEMY